MSCKMLQHMVNRKSKRQMECSGDLGWPVVHGGTKGHKAARIWIIIDCICIIDNALRVMSVSRSSNGNHGGLIRTMHSCKDETDDAIRGNFPLELYYPQRIFSSPVTSSVTSPRAVNCDQKKTGGSEFQSDSKHRTMTSDVLSTQFIICGPL